MIPLKRPQYIHINLRDIPDEIIEECKPKEKQTQKLLYISSPTAECMAYHNQDYWPTNYLKSDLTNADTNTENNYPDSGNTNVNLYSSH